MSDECGQLPSKPVTQEPARRAISAWESSSWLRMISSELLHQIWSGTPERAIAFDRLSGLRAA
jgi:hypothetical protein